MRKKYSITKRSQVLLDRKTFIRKPEKAYRKLKESWETAKESSSGDQQSWDACGRKDAFRKDTRAGNYTPNEAETPQ